MAKLEHQKLKILYLKKLLEDRTDELHPISMSEILEALEQKGIHAERKSIYSDISQLQEYGVDIQRQHGSSGGYYLASREFELPELRLLVDAVQASKFLTAKKSLELIEKLGRLASQHESASLRRQVVVPGRVKNMNESIYYNVDALEAAIAENVQISFSYFDWGVNRERQFRGENYVASPYSLIWDNENYYLAAHSDRHGLTHYRVDKMQNIRQLGIPRFFDRQYQRFNAANYGRNVFGMFRGEATLVKLRFHNSLAGVIIDRFGRDCVFVRDGEEHFIFSAEIFVSPNFLGWLTGFGARAKILHPETLIAEYQALCQFVLAQYDEPPIPDGQP